MDYSKLTLIEIRDGILEKKFTSQSVLEHFIKKCKEKKHLNAILEVFEDSVERAKEIDSKLANGKKVGKLAGVPIAIKDIILKKGKKATCCSKFLENFVSPYTASIVKRLEDEGAIIFARTNMDEFAMGGSCERSVYGPCKNAFDESRVSGGSSGGSAVAVAAGLCPCAIGTDTGGSIRQPSSFNGVVGIKPTYGTVSRYGVIAFASSLDQASPITKTIEDNQLVLSVMAGKDENEMTSIDNKISSKPLNIERKLKIGICKEVSESLVKLPQNKDFQKAVEKLKINGHEIVEISLPHIKYSLACYYIIAPAEATSNFGRFDGIKHTRQSENARKLDQVYEMSRTEGFGKEVQRRIMLGNFVLSSGYYDAYYGKAKRLQAVITDEFEQAFKKCDCIMLPTTPGVAFKIGEKIDDPVVMYSEDLFTVPSNIAGIPALTVPYAKGENNLPLGMQFFGAKKSEEKLYAIARVFQDVIKGGNA